MYLLYRILLGLIALSGGHIPHAIFAAIGGVVCDFIIGNYEIKAELFFRGMEHFALADF